MLLRHVAGVDGALGGGAGFHMWSSNFEGRRQKGAGPHTSTTCRTCPVVDILKATQQGAAPVQCGCRLGWTRRGAHWRHLANTIEPSVCGGDATLCQILWLLVPFFVSCGT